MNRLPTPSNRKRFQLLAGGTAAALLVAAVAVSQEAEPSPEGADPKPTLVPDEVRHRPSLIPDRVVLTWSGDPATTQAVTWRTSPEARSPKAQINLAGENKQFAADAATVEATSQVLKSDLNDAVYHTAEFSDLKPDTLYAYRVGDGVNWTEWFHFRTASDEREPFSFIYFGDAQNDVREHWSRVIRQAYGKAAHAKFFLHAGDLINNANRDAEWGEWFAAGGWVNGSLPSIATPGNHEYRSGLSMHWRPQFAFPENGPPGLEETVYYIDYQGVRIISLNSNEGQEEQVPWLRKVLADNPNKWTVLTFHHPIFSPAKGRDNKKLREIWKPIFDEFNVDLVLQGHDHTYARSGLIHGENVAVGTQLNDSETGTVYVVSVSGPKMYALDGDKVDWARRSAEQTQLFQVIDVDGDTIRYEAYTATGRLFDVFELHKSEEGVRSIKEWDDLKADRPAEGEEMGFHFGGAALVGGLVVLVGLALTFRRFAAK